MMKNGYFQIIDHYKKLLSRHGKNNIGLGWNSKKKNNLRFKLILKIIRSENVKKNFKILDFGCGLSDLHSFLKTNKVSHKYFGIDTNLNAINFSKKKFINNTYYSGDFLNKNEIKLDTKYDIIVINGVFTIKKKLSDSTMLKYIFLILKKLKKNSKKIILFNVLTNVPDWKNKDNYYPNVDKFSHMIKKNFECNYTMLYEKKLHELFYVLKL